jgi:hypothetical protein
LQNGVFLLNTKPRFFGLVGIENLLSEVSEVSVSWYKILVSGITPEVSLAKNHHVVTSSERIWENEGWFEDNF